MRALVKTLVLVAWVILIPTAALAQAVIAGTVRDPSGAVLPGVTVEASSPELIEKVRTAVSDGTGQYRIEDLRPGTYAVTFTLSGFNTFKRDGIVVSAGSTLALNAELSVGALEETITVTGESPVVDIQNTRQQQVLGSEVLTAIPRGHNAEYTGVLLPGVIPNSRGDVGGSNGEPARALMVHGSYTGDGVQTVDGLWVHIMMPAVE